MKHEWRKQEKKFYLPKTKPEVVEVPEFQFITLGGKGNPNSPEFAKCIETLFGLAYAIKMNLKKVANPPQGYQDWTVYPLEGVWDLSEKGKQEYDGTLNKDELVFTLMIRQPDFVTKSFFQEMLELTKNKKPNPLLEKVQLQKITDGKCVQMMHIGSYDDEPASFERMEEFATAQGLTRTSKMHREIYLSDFRKVEKEKLKTTLRFWVK